MNDEPLEQVEKQIGGLLPVGAPRELRGAVLADVGRELRAARWDRRLARIAAVLLIVGLGLNVGVIVTPECEYRRSLPLAGSSARQSLVNTAVVVAEATDARTGGEYARQMAAMLGHRLTADDVAAIDAAVRTELHEGANGKKG